MREGGVIAGWSGGDQVAEWERSIGFPYSPYPKPDLNDFITPMRLFMIGHNGTELKGAHRRDGHTCRRIRV